MATQITPRVNTRIPLTHLKAWRIARVLTQRALATKAGVNKMTISNLEQGTFRANFSTVQEHDNSLSARSGCSAPLDCK
jgi:DNA-binding XRE family transcriptional regulator